MHSPRPYIIFSPYGDRREIPSRSLRSSGVLPDCQGYHKGVGHASACSHNQNCVVELRRACYGRYYKA